MSSVLKLIPMTLTAAALELWQCCSSISMIASNVGKSVRQFSRRAATRYAGKL